MIATIIITIITIIIVRSHYLYYKAYRNCYYYLKKNRYFQIQIKFIFYFSIHNFEVVNNKVQVFIILKILFLYNIIQFMHIFNAIYPVFVKN